MPIWKRLHVPNSNCMMLWENRSCDNDEEKVMASEKKMVESAEHRECFAAVKLLCMTAL